MKTIIDLIHFVVIFMALNSLVFFHLSPRETSKLVLMTKWRMLSIKFVYYLLFLIIRHTKLRALPW